MAGFSTEDSRPWSAPTANGPVLGVAGVPGSKSITNRALVLAALAEDDSVLKGALLARDTRLMIAGLTYLGAQIDIDDTTVSVTPIPPGEVRGGIAIDCGLAGTVMRFLPPVGALANGTVSFDGDDRARARPMTGLLTGLRQLGVAVDGDSLPMTVRGAGKVNGGPIEIDASASSQFVSGLLLAAPRYRDGLQLRHRGRPLPSLPHIEMTTDMLRAVGVTVVSATADPSDCRWQVAPGPIRALSSEIEPDLSNAGPFLAAAMVTAGTVTIPGWPAHTTQAGNDLRHLFSRMGAQTHLDSAGLTLLGPARPIGVEVDLGHAGELVPTIAAVAAVAASPSRITGVAHLRGHETDRLAALVTELHRLGVAAEELPDGLAIYPGGIHGALVETYHDHRMATFAAIIGLVVPGVRVTDIDTTSKTLPDFPTQWQKLVSG